MSDRRVTVPEHMRRGADGERRAVEALRRRGYELIETNWRCAAGELDAVMRDGDQLVFVEVKTRTGASRGTAEASLTPAKARKLAMAAEWYLADHPELGDPIWRIDLVAITLDGSGNPTRFTHITNAALIG
ncbi:MAG: YraN family protein [Thermomicrobiales bacterium]|nr:YraN family protein [Thermomicrobiales bacterium]MCO5221628.1 YraN family protein [Thermomicrobiales bacterium]